jgi:peptidoglycan/LPS O-acetylase OafA/YrhL
MISPNQTSAEAMTNNTYWPALDGLRAVSILLVLTVHLRLIGPQSKVLLPAGGFLGVDMFFVISGFLITSLLLSEYRQNGSISLKSFYYRRALRLFPALAAVLLFAFFVAVFLGSFSALGLSPVRLSSTIFYFTNWIRAYEGTDSWFLFHFWSLSVEEQFYLLWPALLLFLLRRRLSSKHILLIVLAMIITSAVLKPVLFLTGSSINRVYYGSDTRADSVLIGCAAAVLLSFGFIQPSQRAKLISLSLARASAIVLAVFVCLAFDGFKLLYVGGFTLVSLCSATVVVHLMLAPESALSHWLSLPSLRWIGKRSYGLYLWHWPMFEIARLLPNEALVVFAGLALTFLAAQLSYRYIETPFLGLKNRRLRSTNHSETDCRNVADAIEATNTV